ncbi:MAG: hypothetical protein ABI744_04040 [Chloroflexota bacterium]
MKFLELEGTVRRKLDAAARESGDRILSVHCACGVLLGKTKVSRKPNEQIGPGIAARIPQQLGITKQLWVDIYSCHKGRAEYIAAHGHASH